MGPKTNTSEKGHNDDQHPSRRQRWGWLLFDFANSVLIINGSLYFPQWIVVDNHVSGTIYNLTALLTSVLLIATAPLFGIQADRHGRRFYYLTLTSGGLLISGLALGIGGLYLESGIARNTFCLISFGAALYFYQLSLVFYNSLLNTVSGKSSVSSLSGYGLAWGWVGGILAVLAIDPLVKGQLFFHAHNRINAILPSTIVFGLLTALSLWLMRDLHETVNTAVTTRPRLSDFFRELRGYPILLLFLMAFFLYSDAILTIENNVTIFMEKVFAIADEGKGLAFIGFLVIAAIAAAATRRLDKPIDSLRTLRRCILCWVITIPIASLVRGTLTFVVCFLVMGILYGILFNASRVLFFQLSPTEKIAEYFGVYASFERFASILGPLLWSLPLLIYRSEDALSYRYALCVMTLPIILAFCLLQIASRWLDASAFGKDPEIIQS